MSKSKRAIALFKVCVSGEAVDRVAQVLGSGYIGQGPRVEEFEERFQALVEAPVRPLATNSGTSAIDLALHLCGVGPGTECVSTPQTCAASNVHILHRGAKIVWADVDPLTGLIDPKDVAKKITPKTRAILAVDWGGAPCDYAALHSLGVPVIEDAAHAMLARYNGQSIARTGGHLVCWSHQAIKHFNTGDGGSLLVPEDQYERARLLRWYGLDRTKGESFRCSQGISEAGFKYHMNDVAAAIGLANLGIVREVVAQHRENAAFYTLNLPRGREGLYVPPLNLDSAWWLYTLLVRDRERFMARMAERGIATSPVHMRNDGYECFRDFAQPPGSLPGVDVFSASEVAIPVGWWLSAEDRERVVEAVLASVREG